MKYFIIYGLLLLITAVKSSSQVVAGPFYAGCEQCANTDFHDIKDTTTNFLYYNMDLDSNGVDDLKFLCSNYPQHGAISYITLVFTLNNSMISSSGSRPGLVMQHDSMDIVSDQLNWSSTADTLAYTYIVYPPFASTTNRGLWGNEPKYMAVKLDDTDSARYAWIRLSVPSPGKLTVYNYGIQKKLPAVGIHENSLASFDISLYPNPARDYTLIQCRDFNYESYKLEILDMKGEIVFSDKITDSAYKLNTSQMAKGIYAVHVIKEDKSVKIMKLIVQ